MGTLVLVTTKDSLALEGFHSFPVLAMGQKGKENLLNGRHMGLTTLTIQKKKPPCLLFYFYVPSLLSFILQPTGLSAEAQVV